MAKNNLAGYVTAHSADHPPMVFGPDDELPDWAAKAITNPAAWKPEPDSGYPEGEPSEDWKGADLDAYAQAKGVDLAGAKNKAEKVAALAAATPA